MKWKVLGYLLILFAVLGLLAIPIDIYKAWNGSVAPHRVGFVALAGLALGRAAFSGLLYVLGRFFLRNG